MGVCVCVCGGGGGGGGEVGEGDGIEKQVEQQERNHLCPFNVSVDNNICLGPLLIITLFFLIRYQQ